MTTISQQLSNLLNSTRKMLNPKTQEQKPWPAIDFPKGELPDKPSELIFVALRDLRACESDTTYKIDMWTWHTGQLFSDEVCAVCLAGSVMAKSLDASNADHYTPNDFGRNRNKLVALNCLRIGGYGRALRKLNKGRTMETAFGIKPGMERPIRSYEQNRDGFFEDMTKFAWDLHRAGQ